MNTARYPVDLIFFDIDGTLIDMNTKEMTRLILETLKRLQKNGIRIALCTGRSPMTVPDLGIQFDAIAACNGSLCVAGDTILRSHPIDIADAVRLRANAAALGLPITIVTQSGVLTSGWEQNLADYFAIGKTVLEVTPDFDAHFEQEDIYQMMVGAAPEQYGALMEGASGAKLAAWWNRAVDIVPATGGKGEGVRAIADHFGIDPARCAAFGDGANDLEMLQAVGHPIAMGNACDELKAAAQEVCLPVDQDGIYDWCLKNGLLDEN